MNPAFFKKILYTMTFLLIYNIGLANDKLIIGIEGAYPPFSEVNKDGYLIGFDVDIANALCKEIEKSCEFVKIDWDGLIPALKEKKIDAVISSMSATEERKNEVAFSKKYYKVPGKAIRKKGGNFQFSKEGLKGKKIGVQKGTTFDKYVTDSFSDTSEIFRYKDKHEIAIEIQSGKIDVAIADSLVMKEYLDTEIGRNFEFFGSELNNQKYFNDGVAVAVNKDNKGLAAEFSKAIEAIRANGVYKEINSKYFDFDVYND